MRKLLITSLAAAVCVLMLTGFVTRADDDELVLRARLRGTQEVPPIATPGTAEFNGTISADRTTITFSMDWADLKAPAIASHIHFGPRRVNGGVMVFLCGGGGQAVCVRDTSGHAEGTITSANVVGPAGQGIDPTDPNAFAEVIRAIVSGNAYVNIHSTKFPGGEIRGQVRVHRAEQEEE